MLSAELGLAILATVDLCIKYGKRLVDMCASFRGAESEIAERVLRIESCWMRTSLQLDFVQRVADVMPEDHRSIYNQILDVLLSKIKIAIAKLETVMDKSSGRLVGREEEKGPSGPLKRWKYVLIKEGLDKAMQDLEMWQGISDPSWYLIMKVASPQVDAELARGGSLLQGCFPSTHVIRNVSKNNRQLGTGIFLPEDGLKSAHVLDIPFSSAKLAQRAGSSKWMIIDLIACSPQGDSSLLTEDVRDLALRLSHAEPMTFGLPVCRGVVKRHDSLTKQVVSFTFVFRMPQGFDRAQSLRKRLLDGNTFQSLSDRFRIAKELAKSVSYVHTFGFVHKNIRPETVLLLSDRDSLLAHTFLVGFEKIRTEKGRSLGLGDSVWERNLYRHPRRQGLDPEDYYIMQHDIYSLGVCLLEVGLSESLVMYGRDGNNPSASPILGSPPNDAELRLPLWIRGRLLSLTRDILPKRMGNLYAEIVETCLTCLDEDNSDFGDEGEFQDADGILVGVRYIEKVLQRLDNINV